MRKLLFLEFGQRSFARNSGRPCLEGAATGPKRSSRIGRVFIRVLRLVALGCKKLDRDVGSLRQSHPFQQPAFGTAQPAYSKANVLTLSAVWLWTPAF